MRVLWIFAVFTFSISAAAAEEIKVASINLCADQLVLLLADEEQIISLSNLSHRKAGSYFYKKAQVYPVNEGHAEQILGYSPDLVIVGQFSRPHTVNILKAVGLSIQTLPIANSVQDVFNNIQSVADWIGKRERGVDLVAKLQARLDKLTPDASNQPLAAAFDPNGYTSGKQSLRGQVIELAGFRNAASVAGIESYGKLSLEAMIKHNPEALIESPYSPGTWSRAQATSQHPALKAAGINPQIIDIPSRMMVCGGPWTLDVIEQLQAERLNITAAQ